ncbi:MAG TPA: hypothetical protein VHX68_14435 [Planctomycetaceae bacterium]|nr:hypothetical protein [Planctomycetaceae bacterium]
MPQRTIRIFAVATALSVAAWGWTVFAEGTDDGPKDKPEGRSAQDGPPRRPPPPPLEVALDLNDDHEISAEELDAATASLKKLDKNGDGKLTPDELRPTGRRGGRGGNYGPGRNGNGPGGADDGGPGPGRGGFGGDRGGPGPDPAGPDADAGPPGQGQFGQRGGNGQGGPGRGPGGPPSPQRLVEHAMRFDTNGDGKLDRTELLNFAKDFVRHAPGRQGGRGGNGGPGQDGPGFGGPGGRGGDGGQGPGGPPNDDQSNRPQRPDRPE